MVFVSPGLSCLRGFQVLRFTNPPEPYAVIQGANSLRAKNSGEREQEEKQRTKNGQTKGLGILEPGNFERQNTMIAANYRKNSSAMALQLVLPFGRPVWALQRPTTRILRAIRAARGAAFKLAGYIAYPEKTTTPQWFKDAARKARQLAASVKAALMQLPFKTETPARIETHLKEYISGPADWHSKVFTPESKKPVFWSKACRTEAEAINAANCYAQEHGYSTNHFPRPSTH